MPGVNRNVLHDLKVRSTDPESQEHIADILSSYDDLMENKPRRMALLEEASRQLYREWFVRLRFPGRDHTRITNGVPQGWYRVPLRVVAIKIGSGSTPHGDESSYLPDGTPLMRTDFARSLLQHNRELYGFIRDVVPVEWRDEKGETCHARARVIDFRNETGPDGKPNNRSLVVRELKVQGQRVPQYNRRADLICFVNGLPLVFIKLKAV